jgi:hypothetical protein
MVTIEGNGIVRAADGHIDCGPRCAAAYDSGRVVTLRADPKQHFFFERWIGACVGTTETCVIAVDEATAVRAVFARLPGGYVDVTVGGPGSIVSTPNGISCGRTRTHTRVDHCYGTFGERAPIRLRAVPARGSAFVAWGGACRGAFGSSCRLVGVSGEPDEHGRVAVDRVRATFRRSVTIAGKQPLTVTYRGGFFRPMTSRPIGIHCPDTCSALFSSGSVVTLRGLAAWGGACVGVSAICTLAVDAPTHVRARLSFRVPPPGSGMGCCAGALGLNVTVTGRGHVVDGHKIDCSGAAGGKSDCQQFFRPGAAVVLNALPAQRFVEWGGSCRNYRNDPTCRLSVIAAKGVTARFSRR